MNNLLSRILILAGVLAITTASHAAERIVSLGGAVTETVYALGAGDELVARDTSSVYPAAALKLPDVGYFRTIGAEGVLSQNPTLILAASGTGPESQIVKLRESGINWVHLDATPSVEATVNMISEIGRQVHREVAAAALVARLNTSLRQIETTLADGRPRPRVVFLMGMSAATTQAAYEGTAADALIKLAGGENALSGMRGYKAVSPEALFALDPDVILYGTNPHAPHQEPPAWINQTRAGRTGRVHALDLGYHLVFGPRLGDAGGEVAALLHPEIATVANGLASSR